MKQLHRLQINPLMSKLVNLIYTYILHTGTLKVFLQFLMFIHICKKKKKKSKLQHV